MAFNPNELIIERVRSVEEYNITTGELEGRYTQIEDPSLTTSSESSDVVDAMSNVIATFYKATTGTFGFSNSLFSLDLAASQFGSKKIVAGADSKIQVPVSETIAIASDHTVELKYIPVGTEGSEIKFVKVINKNNTFGDTYNVGTTVSAEDKTFTIDAANKKITMPDTIDGKVFVNYVKESENAVTVERKTDGIPEVKKLIIHAILCDPCNVNLKYSAAIVAPRAQLDPSSVDLTLTMEGKHAASYLLKKEYCEEDASLFTIIVSED